MSIEWTPSDVEREGVIKALALNIPNVLLSSVRESLRNNPTPSYLKDNLGVGEVVRNLIPRLGFDWPKHYIDSHWPEFLEEAVRRYEAGKYALELRVTNALQCVCPLLFCNDDSQFSYSLGATCLLVRFRGKYYGITPAHCLRDRHVKSVCIGADDKSKSFLPIRQSRAINKSDSFDTDWCDLAFLEIADDRLPKDELARRTFFELDDHLSRKLQLVSEAPLLFKGYPYEISKVEYDLREIGRLSFIGDARFWGHSESKGCGMLKFSDLSGIGDANGLSGSPVIHLDVLDPQSQPMLAGVLIRGTKESMLGHFIYSGVILNVLRQITGSQGGCEFP